MEYKVITIRERLEIGATSHENDLSKLKEWIEQGFIVQNFSCTHIPKQNNVFGDTEEKPTLLFMVSSYFLVRQDD